MGLWQFIREKLGLSEAVEGPGKWGVDELARRLNTPLAELRAMRPSYRSFVVPKRSGGSREIHAPEPALRDLQKRILRRLLRRLRCHPAVTGFERGHSIVTNALPHAGRAVVIRMDLKEFFSSTTAKRVKAYFRSIGWSSEAADLLTALCTHRGALPQGAPTSPRLSNLVNVRMDAGLYRLAAACNAVYTRYADDLTFSFETEDRAGIRKVIRGTKWIVRQYGYTLHSRRKLHISRRHNRQLVTGLVVNSRVNLPRPVRRRLRAIEHHHRTGRPATLTPIQFQGWQSLRAMISAQRIAAG